MTGLELVYLNGADVERLALTEAEIAERVEQYATAATA